MYNKNKGERKKQVQLSLNLWILVLKETYFLSISFGTLKKNLRLKSTNLEIIGPGFFLSPLFLLYITIF